MRGAAIFRSIKINAENILTFYIVVSVVVYVELFSLSTTITYLCGRSLPSLDVDSLLIPNINYILFSVIFLMFISRKLASAIRPDPRLGYLVLHGLALLAFVIYVFTFVTHYPFPPLDRDNVFLKIALFLGKGTTGLHIRFSFLFLVIAAGCHCGLLLIVLKGRDLAARCLAALVLSFFLGALHEVWIAEVLWRHLSLGVARIVFLLLKMSGLEAVFYYAPVTDAIIGTDSYIVSIAYPCSGLTGMYTFLLAFAAMFFLKREKLDRTRAFVVAYVGVFAMYVANLVRIYLLILIGHFGYPELAVDLWHSEGSTIFYAVVIAAILRVGYGWMTGSSGKEHEARTPLSSR
jgi:exosortase/archaeosortase family protein